MNKEQFEHLLDKVTEVLTKESKEAVFQTSKTFEDRVREVLIKLGDDMNVDLTPHPHVFPDILLGEFGVEVKFTTNNTWRSIANSVFEGTRGENVKHIYILFGKMGGDPEVRWGKYEDCVMHVRTSHVPRFEVEMYPEKSLFEKMGVTYDDFYKSAPDEKMKHVRQYARSRLKPGERLWWLEDKEEQEHTLPVEVRLYMNLSQEEKRRIRAEGALLCPQIVMPSRTKNKYTDVVMYILTYHGVMCPQARDLFSAGSVALRGNSKRGGNYILRALEDIQDEMKEAAKYLENALFVEYWGREVQPKDRISEWLKLADQYAKDWKPSEALFKD